MKKVEHVEVIDRGDKWEVKTKKTFDEPLGEAVFDSAHFFPKDAIEWRAAEYQIDPTDIETLLDIVLVEPYLTEEEWAEGFRLHNAPTREVARVDHLARIAKAKLRLRISTRTPDSALRAARKSAINVLDKVRTESWMDPEALEIKNEMTQRGRRVAMNPPPEETRQEKLRKELRKQLKEAN